MNYFLQANLGILLVPLLFLFLFYFGKNLKKYDYRYELGALIIVSINALLSLGLFGFRFELLERFLQSGHLSLAFFLLVMFTGVLPKKSKPFKVLMQVRGQMAILAFIFLLPHAYSKLSLALAGYNFTGLIAFIVFIPLVFTSFMPIRKKMDPKNWKKLHQFSYITYFLLYLHLGFDILIGNSFSFAFSQYSILYHLLLLLYIGMRLYLITIPKLKKKRYEN